MSIDEHVTDRIRVIEDETCVDREMGAEQLPPHKLAAEIR